MPQVIVTIDGKTFRMACAEGEEDHLAGLAADVDARVGELRKSFGEIGDQRLVVMAAIMATDELAEQRRRVAALEQSLAETERARQDALRRAEAGEDRLVAHLDAISEAIERAAQRLDARR
ncbi:cell division protein ZapA [Aureimonas endophytica]|uniref:Cell division protein ZapA n=1 Tax=Aureimonas endophytica TaxID=2027858 RepID=A0A916ZGD7_9HYPH|nr:cell division protein ZapA [Aureimonas endophytica]GGD94525.1 cell division protein ZapA [Aureimonas endophytica]